MNNEIRPFYCREASVSYGPRKTLTTATFRNSHMVGEFVRSLIGGKDVEHFVVIALDARHRALAWTLNAKGTETSCQISRPSVFRFLLLSGGTSFILAHNHPSGDPTPSEDDISLTKKIEEGAEILGLKLLDHVIIGDDSIVSLDEARLLSRSFK